MAVPPVFIVVCQNTAISKAVGARAGRWDQGAGKRSPRAIFAITRTTVTGWRARALWGLSRMHLRHLSRPARLSSHRRPGRRPIAAAITTSRVGERPIKVVLAPSNPDGSTAQSISQLRKNPLAHRSSPLSGESGHLRQRLRSRVLPCRRGQPAGALLCEEPACRF